jgi:hypothetical protein
MGNDVGGPVGNPSIGPPWAVSARSFMTGSNMVETATEGTDTTPVVTETYIAELPVEQPCLALGFALLNGSAVAGNVVAILYSGDGRVIANTLLAGTVQAGIAAFQRIPFLKPIRLVPGTYYAGVQFNNVAARFRAWPFGNFGQQKKTGEVFGVPTSIVALPPPTTFTTNVGPIGGLY